MSAYSDNLAMRYKEIECDEECSDNTIQVIADFRIIEKECPTAMYYIEFLINEYDMSDNL